MKTTNYYLKKSYGLAIFILLLPFTFASCRGEGADMRYPEPSENPINLTSEEQTKHTIVKHLIGISPENPETDKVYVNNTQTATTNPETIIENDWITITEGGYMPMENLKIGVKENSASESRSYRLTIHSSMRTAYLTITQSGKIGN